MQFSGRLPRHNATSHKLFMLQFDSISSKSLEQAEIVRGNQAIFGPGMQFLRFLSANMNMTIGLIGFTL